jgi:hypothetical protein
LPQLPSKDINTQLDFIAGDGQWRSDAEYAAIPGSCTMFMLRPRSIQRRAPVVRCGARVQPGNLAEHAPFVIFEIGDIKAEGPSGEIERALLVRPHAQRIAARWPGLGSPR